MASYVDWPSWVHVLCGHNDSLPGCRFITAPGDVVLSCSFTHSTKIVPHCMEPVSSTCTTTNKCGSRQGAPESPSLVSNLKCGMDMVAEG